MPRTDFNQLLEAGVHFGHLKRKWNPKMAPYIFMEKNGIHIIDLHKTVVKVDEAAAALKQIAKSGRRILFVATKSRRKRSLPKSVRGQYAVCYGALARRYAYELPHHTQGREEDGDHRQIDRRRHLRQFLEKGKLQISRQRAKLEKNLGSIADLTRLPAALFVVDVQKEQNAVKEAKRLSIPVFAMVDTCCDPTDIDYVIPANDDATKSIAVIIDAMTQAIAEGLTDASSKRTRRPKRLPPKARRGRRNPVSASR